MIICFAKRKVTKILGIIGMMTGGNVDYLMLESSLRASPSQAKRHRIMMMNDMGWYVLGVARRPIVDFRCKVK